MYIKKILSIINNKYYKLKKYYNTTNMSRNNSQIYTRNNYYNYDGTINETTNKKIFDKINQLLNDINECTKIDIPLCLQKFDNNIEYFNVLLEFENLLYSCVLDKYAPEITRERLASNLSEYFTEDEINYETDHETDHETDYETDYEI